MIGIAVARTVLDKISQREFLEHVRDMGEYFLGRLKSFSIHHASIKQVRGRGLMIGIELTSDYTPQQIVEKARERCVLVISAGSNTVRLLPPLIVQKEHIDEAMQVFEECFTEMEQGK
jgi:acetylornithine/N-succinyldiaminopimelate aminotransferase